MSQAQDLFKLFASRAVPGAQLVDRVAVLGDLLEEVQKRMSGIDELEGRVAELERRVNELEAKLASQDEPAAGDAAQQ